jgi:hypothetical protein
MFLLSQAPRFITGTPELINTDGKVTFALPVLNAGTGAAGNVRLTDISLGPSARLIPPAMPVFLGELAVDNSVSVNARFDGAGLIVGNKYLITARGTYESDGSTYGFAVNRSIAIPAPSALPVELLQAHVETAVASGVWAYTLFNDELADSPQHINAFSMDVVAPVTVTGTPAGWQFLTDNVSYVAWYAEDLTLPYPHHVAPGSSLGGFQIQSARANSESIGFAITAWNHDTDQAGLVQLSATLSPSRVS